MTITVCRSKPNSVTTFTRQAHIKGHSVIYNEDFFNYMISKSSEISILQDGSYLDNVISISSSCQACQYWLDSMWFMSTGVVNGLDYFGNKIIFLIKGKAVSLQCNFYCMVSWCFLRDAPQKAVSSLDTYRFVPYICFSFMVYVQGVIYLCLDTFLKIDLQVLWTLMRMFFIGCRTRMYQP